MVIKKDINRFTEVNKVLFSCDYTSDPDEFLIETPFTFMHWRQIEMLNLMTTDTTLAAQDAIQQVPLTPSTVQALCLNILPDCRTVMHKDLGKIESGPAHLPMRANVRHRRCC